jgi:MipA family protein
MMIDRSPLWRAGCLVLGAGAALVALAPPARAQETLGQQQLEQSGLTRPSKTGWDVTLGIGVAGVPTYDGAEKYRARPVPLVSIRYDDLLFLGPEGLGLTLLHWNGLRAGPVLGYGGGRDQSDDPHLNGLGDIQPALTAGGFASYSFGRLTLATTLRQAVTHESDGLSGNLRLTYRQALIPARLELSAGPLLDVANGRYEETYFGVTGAQSASSGLPVYTPHGGLRDYGFTLGLTYHWSEHVLMRSFAALRELTGDAGNSPIVQSKTQGLVGAGIAYHF